MEAKEMFEALGYEEKIEFNSIFYYQCYTLHGFENENVYKYIEFSPNGDGNGHYDTPVVRVYIKYDYFGNTKIDGTITLDELKAINKQVEELGWLEDVKD